jgi:hypothetical protein
MKEEYVNSFLAPTKLVRQKELGHSLEMAGMDLVANRFTTFGSSQIRVIFESQLGTLSVRISLFETAVRD